MLKTQVLPSPTAHLTLMPHWSSLQEEDMMHKEGLDKLPNPEAKGGYTLSRFIPIYTYNSTTISHFLSSVFKEQCMI